MFYSKTTKYQFIKHTIPSINYTADIGFPVSVIFCPHGRTTSSSNLRYFPSLSLAQTLYTVIYLTQPAKNMMGETDVTDITAKR